MVVLVVVVGGLSIAWLIDSHAHGGRVVRHVTLAGRGIGGMTAIQLAGALGDLATKEEHAPVQVRTPQGSFSVSADSLGLRVRQDVTEAAAMAAGRHGWVGARLWKWVVGFVSPARVRVDVGDDRSLAYQYIRAAPDPGPRQQPVEPSLAARNGNIVVIDGLAGRGVDPNQVLAALPSAATRGLPLVLRVQRGPVPPEFGPDDVRPVAEAAERLTAAPLAVSAGTVRATLPTALLRSWMRAVPSTAGTPAAAEHPMVLGIDAVVTAADLAKLLPNAGTPAVDASFTLVNSVPQLMPSRTGTACCGREAAVVILSAVEHRPAPAEPLSLPLKIVPPHLDDEAARKLGIVEQVSTFTTPHPAGQSRVINIHRIADLMRGAIILPGQVFSVNAYVGPRTTAKGFVDAPVIGEHNAFSHDIGGGVSQFGTTMFNAAFFDGLDIVEYQMHTVYISRYPYGREATLNYPHPDLKIRNNSPYGVLVWTSYTDHSLTVTFYSTHWVDAAQTGQTTKPRGPCTAVVTQRTRRWVSDGHTSVDQFYAQYAPQEGIDCPR